MPHRASPGELVYFGILSSSADRRSCVHCHQGRSDYRTRQFKCLSFAVCANSKFVPFEEDFPEMGIIWAPSVCRASIRSSARLTLLIVIGAQSRLRSLFARPCLGQTVRDDGVGGRVKRQPDVGSRNLKIAIDIPGQAITPIDDAIVAGVDGCLQHRVWNAATQGIDEVTRTSAGVAGWQDS